MRPYCKSTALVVLAFFLGSAPAPHASAEVACDGLGCLQFNSLQSVFYRNGPLPPPVTTAEVEALAVLKADPDLAEDAARLDRAIPADVRFPPQTDLPAQQILQVLAARDHDGDGIRDFRISIHGYFRENDPDVDCDGIANILDADPYGAVSEPGPACAAEPGRGGFSNDANANGVPDHLDWRLTKAGTEEGARMADLQEGLFRDYRILLLERQIGMPPYFADEVDLSIRRIFKDQITPDYPPLRYITTDLGVCADYGWNAAHNQTIVFRQATSHDLDPYMRVGIIVHELIHSLQFAHDYTEADLDAYRNRNHWEPHNYHAFSETLGWQHTRTNALPPDPPRLVVWGCGVPEFYPFHAHRDGVTIEQMQEEWHALYAQGEEDGVPLPDNEALRERHLIGEYSLKDPWEWHADMAAAVAMNEMLDNAKTLCTPEEYPALREAVLTRIAEEWYYVYGNAKGLDAYEEVLRPAYTLTSEDWAALARDLILPAYPGLCTP